MATLTDNTRGAILMMASMACFTINDACMKAVGVELPFFQALFLRGVATTCLMLLLARMLGGLIWSLPRRDWHLIGLRTLGEVSAAYFFITALFNMPLANISAIIQVIPLAVTLAGALFLKEPLGWRRFSAILVGFFGVMLIVRPGTEGFTIYSVYGLISVAGVTLRDLATRRMSAKVPSMTVAVSGSIGVTLFAASGAVLIEWEPVTVHTALLLAGATIFVIGGYLCSVMVMRVGDLSAIAPFRYTALIWALVLGYLAFGDWPSTLTLIGAAIVAATGIYTLLRERRLKRRATASLPIR